MWIKRFAPMFAPEDGAGAGAAAGGAAATGTTDTATAAAWHAGVDAEMLGFWQNKGYDVSDPKKVASELTKQYRAAEKHLGVPADRLIRLPADQKDEAGWKEVYGRLGVPADGKEYSFDGIKFADGSELRPAFVDNMRAALAAARVPKDHAATVVKAMVKDMDDQRAAASSEMTAKLAEERASLKTNWGENFDFNHLKAMEGARRLGISREAVTALEGQLGYASIMEAMRKIGSISGEDVFHDGTARTGAMTQEGAISRLAELQADQAWGKRLLSGDPAARREFDNLSRLATGVMEAA